ncbi:LacI family DNA-binding transcriptional regulator [Bifidobacterium simiiventris]|uniref:LacI family DNA-binding transcriptional regulator n=1 Tax=Bifidobacterium simiiventris TaxID=2834434 RepID=UPI001C56E4F9|nr:LacI family DNA-binding transcriptional regulator [Bifidobacterium simiiventris]MBW3077789.1 LacI family DNA-binding transcriptional regulator [Bifidobacterium simiiventris]
MNDMNEQHEHAADSADMSTPVTLADIAKATGFSQMTVSNALRGKPNVSTANRERIRQVAREMGYQANAAAMMLRNRRSGIIQVVVDDFEVPFHARIAKYLTQEAVRHGYQAVVRQSSSSEREEIRAIRPDPGLVYDGIILDAPNITEDQVIGHVQGKPALVIGDCASFTRVDSMDTACVDGVTEAVEHLWRQGCRSFRIFGAQRPSGQSSAHETGKGFGVRRTAAIEETLRAHGIELAAAQRMDCEWTMAGGRDATRLMLDDPAWKADVAAGRCVGIVCLSDVIALGALGTLAAAGVAVPGMAKITGFDGIEMTKYTNPPLTTVEMDVPAMARTVMRRMIAMVEARAKGEPIPPTSHESIPYRLIPRASSVLS